MTTLEDTQRLERVLQEMVAAGVPEAASAPITDAAGSPGAPDQLR